MASDFIFPNLVVWLVLKELCRNNNPEQPVTTSQEHCFAKMLFFFLTPLRVTRRRHATAPQMHTLRRSRSDGVPHTSSAKQGETWRSGSLGRGTGMSLIG